MHFNLIDEPWIPVVDQQGQLVEINIRQALCQASNYEAIESESPLETVAIYRLLLAILHRALQGPRSTRENKKWIQDGFPLDKIENYLERYHHRFDLFDEKAPFYQLGELPESEEINNKVVEYTQKWIKLSTAEGYGNTTPVFNHILRKHAPKVFDTFISPAQAIRKLLEHQTFVLGGLIQKFITSAPGGPSATNALVMVKGDSLHEILCLNMIKYNVEEDEDQPCWEKEPFSITWLKEDPTRPKEDLAQLYTWFSRSIKLLPIELDGKIVIQKIAYASGIRPVFTAQPDDPMVSYRQNDQGYSALGFKESKSFWRDYHAIIPGQANRSLLAPKVIETSIQVMDDLGRNASHIQSMVFGQYNDQAKILYWRYEQLPLPPAIFSQEADHAAIHSNIQTALEEAEKCYEQLHFAMKKLARYMLSHGNREPDSKKDILPFCKSLPYQMLYWSKLESAFSAFISSMKSSSDLTESLMNWYQTLLNTGDYAWNITCQSLGEDAHVLKAVAKSQPIWFAHKNNLKEMIELNQKEVLV